MVIGLVLHSVIKVVSFVVLAAFLTRADTEQLAVAGFLLGVLYSLTSVEPAVSVWPMLRRMRWLFLSLFVLYLWFTPGTPLFFGGPSLEGLEEGLLRTVSLVMLVLAVSLLLHTCAREQLVAAIEWLARPLYWLGIDCPRFALRVVLSLEMVTQAQQLLGRQIALQEPAARPIERISRMAAGLFQGAVEAAENTPSHSMDIPECNSPPVWQWLIPLLLSGCFWLAG